MDTLGIEPRASRMLSGCDTTTPHALEKPVGWRAIYVKTRVAKRTAKLFGAAVVKTPRPGIEPGSSA